jgi:hypothetical protein
VGAAVIVARALSVVGLALVAIGCGGTQEPTSLAVDFRTVGEVQWSMPVQFTAFNTAGKPVLDLTLGHHGLPNKFEIPAGSYKFTVGWSGCPRKTAIPAGRITHVVVTLRGNECSIRFPDLAKSS